MPAFDRAELEEFWQRWLEANRTAQDRGDWSGMAELYAANATYGWSYSPTDHFMATGREEIRALALGTEMLGFAGWSYPYQSAVIDDRSGQVVGFWRQVTTFDAPDGAPYEIPGLGCSWFCYGGNGQWAWQRDTFDALMAQHTVTRVIKDGNLSDALKRRIDATLAGNQPGHYPSLESMSSPLWPVPRVDG